MIKTILFEDSDIQARGIKDILSNIPEIRVIGTYDTIHTALEQCKLVKPQLIITDADIRGDKTIGPLFVKKVKQLLPDVKILGLTIFPQCLEPLKIAGCEEAVLKQFFEENPQRAWQFIKEALLGDEEFNSLTQPPELNQEEHEVLWMIADGLTENQIGEKLEKTRKQVRTIKDSLKDKFGANRDPQLIHHAHLTGYLKSKEKPLTRNQDGRNH